MRKWQVIAARTVLAGGALVFFGSLLPFLSSSEPELYQISSAPQDTATFFGIVLAVIGVVILLAKTQRAKVICGIVTLLAAALTELPLLGLTVAGIAGFDQPDGFGGTIHVNLSPHIGIIIAIIGCAVAGLGAVASFRPRLRGGRVGVAGPAPQVELERRPENEGVTVTQLAPGHQQAAAGRSRSQLLDDEPAGQYRASPDRGGQPDFADAAAGDDRPVVVRRQHGQPLQHAHGVEAAGDHLAKEAAGGDLGVGVERLRVPLPGEAGHLVLGDRVLSQLDD
jgi:hypothetical protein